MEHIARSLGRQAIDIKVANLYHTGQITPYGQVLSYCNIEDMVTQLMSSAQAVERKQQITQFNKVCKTL